jgi:2-C-methyl-D-erythritol 4-phosphate cytidylyltransferase
VNSVQGIAQEWEILGIKVNCMNPERQKTPMRIKNFGNEPDSSLLKPEVVALKFANVAFKPYWPSNRCSIIKIQQKT